MRTPYIEPTTEADRPAGAPAAAAPVVAPSTPAVPLALAWRGPSDVKPGEEFTIELRGNTKGQLKSASVQLRYDPAEVEVLAVDDGGFFKQGGATTVFTPRIDANIGIVFATIGVTGDASATGEGALVTVRARAKGKGAPTRLQMTSVVGVDTAGRRVPIEGAKPLELAVKP
jgi:general secretion pathway protein D